MSESVAPAVVLDTESDIDPGTETPYQEATTAEIEVAEQDEDEEESQEDQNKEMSEDETDEKEEEIWKKRERDYFAFLTSGTETSEDRPLVGRELVRELELHKKMRSQALEQVKKLRNSPYMKKLMLSSSRDPALQGLEGSELDIQGAFMPHPYPL